VEKGPALGEAMRAPEATWIAAGFPGDVAPFELIVSAATHP